MVVGLGVRRGEPKGILQGDPMGRAPVESLRMDHRSKTTWGKPSPKGINQRRLIICHKESSLFQLPLDLTGREGVLGIQERAVPLGNIQRIGCPAPLLNTLTVGHKLDDAGRDVDQRPKG